MINTIVETNSVELFQSVLIAALITGGLTLSGVIYTVHRHSKNLLAQLKHDADERERERVMALKREVFLEASEALTEALQTVGKIQTTNIAEAHKKITFENLYTAISKISLIGKLETIKKVHEMQQAILITSHKLLIEKIPIDALLSEIKTTKNIIEQLQNKQTIVISKLEHLRLQGTDNSTIEEILKFYSSISDDLSAHNTELASKTKKLTMLNLEYSKNILEIIESIDINFTPVVIAIRQELDFHIDVDLYQTAMEELSARSSAIYIEFIKNVEKNL